MATGVLQGGDDLFDHRVVGADERQTGIGLHGDDGVAQQRAEPLDPVVEQLVNGNGLAFWLQRSGFDAAHREEILDEAVEPLGLVGDQLEQFLSSCGVVQDFVAQIGDDRPDGGQRRSQVVRD